ncbi:MAG: MATE family efflux transporter [Pseudomonadota bacterium]
MQLAQIAVNSVEIVYAGQLGPTYLAAATVGSHTFHAAFLFLMGLAIAVAPLVSQARGRGAFREVRRTVRQGLWAVTALSLPPMILLWYIQPIMLALGQAPAVAAAAEDFTRPLTLGLPAWVWYFVLRNFAAAMGRPRPGLYAMLSGVVINAVAGYMLVFGNWGAPDLGITGAGIAATLAAWVVFLVMLAFVFIDPKLKRMRLFARFWRPDWELFKEINRVGLPIGTALFFETLLFLAALYLQGLISIASQAAHGAAIMIIAITFMLPMGVAQAGTVRIGLAVGRRDRSAAGRAAVITFALGLGCTVFTALLLLSVPTTLVGIFLVESQPDAAQVLQLGVAFLAVGALFQLVDGGQAIAMGCLRGLRDTTKPMLIAGFCYMGIGLPLSALLGFETDLAGVGIWIGLAVGLAAAAVLLTWRFYRLWSTWAFQR